MPRFLTAVLLACSVACIACVAENAASNELPNEVARTPSTDKAIAHHFSSEDERLLEQIQHGCFQFLWNEVGDGTGFAKDRRSTVVASIAGIGFQLSSLPIGIERGWITREQGEQRAIQVLRALWQRDDNRREGVYAHFLLADSGDLYPRFKNEASTVDHSLLLAGAMPAAVYFGGETARHVEQMAAETNWRAFVNEDDGYLSMGWWPADNLNMKGDGQLIPAAWRVMGDEERIIYFLAAGCPTPDFALPPRDYYRLRREWRQHGEIPPFIASNSGTPFQYFFTHCWVDHRAFLPDNPAQFDVEGPRVDWFENSRRALLVHRQRCIETAQQFKSFATDRWGVSPCMGYNADGQHSYLVQQVKPNVSERENWQLGTIAPYAAGGSIMFTPAESMAALRAFRELKGPAGEPLVWRDPEEGGYAFADSFNLDQQLVSDDNVAIDVGPMLLAIENARSGLIWRLFMDHPVAKRAVEALKFELRPTGEKEP